MNAQFKKGALELCVLAILSEGDCYGYDLVTQISEHISITEGTIYPLLRRLKDDGQVETYLQESSIIVLQNMDEKFLPVPPRNGTTLSPVFIPSYYIENFRIFLRNGKSSSNRRR